MIRLIDSHCHLTYPELLGQIEAVLRRAEEVGVRQCLTVAQDLDDAQAALTLAENQPRIRVVAGIHPHLSAKAPAGWETALSQILAHVKVCAVGETGLDYHYDFSDRESQQRVFRHQLELAEKTGKPVVIHCREAHDDTMRILGDFPRLAGVVFHCFSGTRAMAREIFACGYSISLTGVVTFKNAAEMRSVAGEAPPDRLLIETDAPYLSPEPLRKVRPNEPALMVHTAECIARERGQSLEEFAFQTTQNTQCFFSLTEE